MDAEQFPKLYAINFFKIPPIHLPFLPAKARWQKATERGSEIVQILTLVVTWPNRG